MKKYLIATLTAFFCITQIEAQVEPLLFYKASHDKKCEQWVDSVFSRLSLKEKVGQLFVYTAALDNTKKNQALIREAVRTYKVGALLFSGGTLQNQALLTNYAQRLAEVPLMMTFDGEWGLAMRLKKNTPVFPKNDVLGCIQDERLIYEYGREMARQCKELGIHVNFAPVADVNRNPKNPVINVRSFGENAQNVSNKVVAYASGLESGGVLSVSKHFPGHGDTDVDSHLALPVLPFSRERLDSVELYPFKQIIRAGLGGVMVGHLEVPVLEPQAKLPSSLSHRVVYGLLTQELNFKGLVFTDALAMKGVSSIEHICLQALQAGNDMVLTPRSMKAEVESVLEALKNGELKEEDINRKCRKVLAYKYALGIRKRQTVRLSGLEKRINSPQSEQLINRLRLAAVTIPENKHHLLPLHTGVKEMAVLSIGEKEEGQAFVTELKKLAPVHSYALSKETSEEAQHALLDSLKRYKRIIISVYTKELKPFKAFLDFLPSEQASVYTFFIPMAGLEQMLAPLRKADAVVIAHSAEKELQAHVAKVLFGKAMANAKLSVSLSGLYLAGTGVTIGPDTKHHYQPEDYGMHSEVLSRIDSIVGEGIRAQAFPGCQVLVLKEGKPVYDKCFGTHVYGGKRQVKSTDLYDLASLSKSTGTLLAVMKLYDKGKFNLSDKVSAYLPFLRGTDKQNISIRELLFHQSGLPASISFYQEAIDEKSYKGAFLKSRKDATHRSQVGVDAYAISDFKYKEGMVSATPSELHTIQVADQFFLNKEFHELALAKLVKAPLKGKKYVYSCVGFVLLKELVEQVSGESLDVFLDREFYIPMGLDRTLYLPLRRFAKEDVVPTVQNDFLRPGLLQGYVHDESAAFFGGVSGNAGLFSTANDVGRIYQMILNGGEYEGSRYLSKETCRLFTTETSHISRRGLGFDKPDAKSLQSSPCSASTPASVYGHTGFTGTCVWVDPEHQLVYVFLSNRIHPVTWNNKLSKMNIRTQIQETIYESMK